MIRTEFLVLCSPLRVCSLDLGVCTILISPRIVLGVCVVYLPLCIPLHANLVPLSLRGVSRLTTRPTFVRSVTLTHLYPSTPLSCAKTLTTGVPQVIQQRALTSHGKLRGAVVGRYRFVYSSFNAGNFADHTGTPAYQDSGSLTAVSPRLTQYVAFWMPPLADFVKQD